MLRELHEEGVRYIPVDPDRSGEFWVPSEENGKRVLVGPLTAIKGIGPAILREVLDSRKDSKPLRENLSKKLALAKTEIDTLFPVADAAKRLHPDLTKVNIFSDPTPVIDAQCGITGDIMIIAKLSRINIKNENDAASVKRRGYAIKGPTSALNMFFADDTDEIFVKIDRYKFETMGRKILDESKVGKSLYAIKGDVPRGFRMISVKNIRYLGEIDD